MYRYFKETKGSMLNSIARVKAENAEKYLNKGFVEITEAQWMEYMRHDYSINYIYD